MKSSRPDLQLVCPSQAELDLFSRSGVQALSIATPVPLKVVRGYLAEDRLFEPEPSGQRWFAFEERDADDFVLWNPTTDILAGWLGRAFALGQSVIDQAATCSFDCNLNVFGSSMDWLRSGRDGIVVLPWKWPEAFDRLRYCPRIAIAESLLPIYRRSMKPARMPDLFVLPARREAA